MDEEYLSEDNEICTPEELVEAAEAVKDFLLPS